MANTKITELTAVTALAGTDVFPVVDVSASTTNKVSVEDLLRNAPDGSADAPSIANAGDQDTGIFFPADNSVGVSTDGTQRLVIDSSGRVGVGTTSPARLLDVNDSADFAVPNGEGLRLGYRGQTKVAYIGIDANDAASPNQSWANSCWIGFDSQASEKNILYRANTNHIFYGVNATERMRIDSSGRVGIGTTSPDDILDVRSGAAGFSQFVHASGNGGIRITGTGASSNANLVFANNHTAAVSDEYTIQLSGNNDRLAFRSGGPGDTERVSFTADGNVGIGASSPADKLHVVGNGRFNDGTNGAIQLGSSSNNRIAGGSSYGGVRYYTNGGHAWYDSSSELMKLDSSGRLLVGTSSSLGNNATLQTSGQQVNYQAFHHQTAQAGPFIILSKSNGTQASPTAVVDADYLGIIGFSGYDGTDYLTRGAEIACQVDGTPGSNDMPGRLVFSTTADGASTPTERVRIDSSGVLNIGTTAAADTDVKLQVAFTGGNSYIQIKSADSTGTSGIKFGRNSVANRAGIDWSASTDALQFRTGGTSERMRIDSSGNVGIGTTSPNEKLVVSGNASVTGALQITSNTSAPSAGAFLFRPASNTLAFGSNSAERLRIDSSGLLGVGTSSPSQLLHIAKASGSAIIELQRTSANTTGTVGALSFTASDGHSVAAIAAVGDGNDEGADLVFRTTSAASSNTFFNSTTERLRIDSSGRVGIGTTSPAHAVHIAGATTPELIVEDTTNNVKAVVGADNTVGRIGTDTNHDLTLRTNDTERMRIDSSGNVGIGTTSPGNTLHLKGAQGVGIRFENSTSTNSSYLTIESGDKYQFNVGGSGYYTWVTGGSEKVRIDSSGRLLVGHSSNSMGCNVESATTGGNNFAAGRFAASTGGPDIVLRKSRNATVGSHTIVQNGDDLGNIFWGGSNGSAFKNAARITAQVDGTPGTGDDMPGRLTFYTSADGSSTPTERMRIGSEGQFSLYSEGAATRTSIVNSGTSAISAAFDIRNNATSTTTGTQVFAVRENGDIYTSGNTTVQSLSSERRLKENIEVIDPAAAWTTIKNTPYYSYNYIGQEGPRYGPIVDEVPADMVRDTDLSDDQGPIRTFDNGMLHARLYSALQQAIAKIETLEAKVAALEAQ